MEGEELLPWHANGAILGPNLVALERLWREPAPEFNQPPRGGKRARLRLKNLHTKQTFSDDSSHETTIMTRITGSFNLLNGGPEFGFHFVRQHIILIECI